MVRTSSPKTKRSLLDELLERLAFVPEDIVEAAAAQPVLYRKAIGYRILKMRDRMAAKAALDVLVARLSLRLRRKARQTGDRVTERNLEALLAFRTDMQTARRVLDGAEEAEEYGKLLLEAYRMRRDCLRIVSGMLESGLGLHDVKGASDQELERMRQRLRERYSGVA